MGFTFFLFVFFLGTAWAKILIAHRSFYCNPDCNINKEDSTKAYLWNMNKFWSVSNDWYTLGSTLALSYDMYYNQLTIQQRKVIKSALALLVMKRWTWGITKNSTRDSSNAIIHPHRSFSNWAMYHSNLYLIHLAIENEINTDSDVLPYVSSELSRNDAWKERKGTVKRFESLISSWWTHSIYPDGTSFEDGYTYHTALREGTLGLLALHRRGINLLDTSRFRNMIHAVLQQYEPWMCGPLVGHASGGGHEYPAYLAFIRFMYPSGVLPRLVWAQQTGKDFDNNRCRFMWMQTLTQLTIFGDDHVYPIAEAVEQLPKTIQKQFPLAWLSPRRGLVIMRSSYSQNASYMHLDARPDGFFPGHDNADRGVITFSALGKRWLDDLPWEDNIESRKHSLVHIDGYAQANKAPSVCIIKAKDYGNVSIASADLTYAYNVQWAPAWQGANSGRGTVIEYRSDGSAYEKEYKFLDAEENSPWDLGWPVEDDAKDIGFMKNMSLNGYDYIGFAGMYQWRRPYRKQRINHIVRSTVMVRSDKNDVGYAILVDSIVTASSGHVFESYLIVENEISINQKLSKCKLNQCIITLDSNGIEKVDLHVYSMGTNLNYRLDKFDGNQRLILKTSGGKDEQFWIAMHPYRENEKNELVIQKDTDNVMSFMYNGEKRKFKVSDVDHSVIDLSVDNTQSSNIQTEIEPTLIPEASTIIEPTPVFTPKPSASPSPSISMLIEATATPTPTVQVSKQTSPPSLPVSNLPMKPIRISSNGWHRVATDELNSSKDYFLQNSSASYQVVFNVTSKRSPKFLDRFTTCGPYTRGITDIWVYDCAGDDQNYYRRNCTIVKDMGKKKQCEMEDAVGVSYRIGLETGKMYFVVVSIEKRSEDKPRIAFGHEFARIGERMEMK